MGAGTGGVLAAMLLLRGDDGHARYSVAHALGFVASSLGSSGCGYGGASLRRVLGDSRLKDTVAPSSAVQPCLPRQGASVGGAAQRWWSRQAWTSVVPEVA